MKKNNRIVGFALLLLLAASPLRAQILSRGDLFGPGAPPPMIGVELGLGTHSQNGKFRQSANANFPEVQAPDFSADYFLNCRLVMNGHSGWD